MQRKLPSRIQKQIIILNPLQTIRQSNNLPQLPLPNISPTFPIFPTFPIIIIIIFLDNINNIMSTFRICIKTIILMFNIS